MTEILAMVGYTVGAIALGFLVVGGAAVLALRWRLAGANRVSPSVKSRAPLWWLCSPGTPGRLHRRLRGAVRLAQLQPVARTADAPQLSVESLRRELEAAAVALDDQLVVAAHHPAAHRRRLLHTLETQVGAVEGLAMRLSHLSQPISGPDAAGVAPGGCGPRLEELSEGVGSLEAARAELRKIDPAARLSAPPAQRSASAG